MNLLSTCKLQWFYRKKDLLILFLILSTMLIVATVLILNATFNTMQLTFDFALYAYLFVGGLMQSDLLSICIQNGISRKSFYLSHAISTLLISVLLSAYMLIFQMVLNAITSSIGHSTLRITSSLTGQFSDNYLSLFLYFLAGAIFAGGLGTFLGSMNVRTTKTQKIIIYASGFALSLISFYVISGYLWDSNFVKEVTSFLEKMYSNISIFVPINLVFAVLALATGWLFIRRSELK